MESMFPYLVQKRKHSFQIEMIDGNPLKSTTTVHPKDFSGLRSLHEDYPEAKLLYLYMGKAYQQKP
jgi:hypothetical protein